MHLVLFSAVFYGGYALYLFLQYKYIRGDFSKWSTGFLFIFPPTIFYLKKFVGRAFGWVIERKSRELAGLQDKLKEQLETIKVETKFYQTRELLEKYESAESAKSTESTESVESAKSVGNQVKKRPIVSTKPTGPTTTTSKQTQTKLPPAQPQPQPQPQPTLLFSPPPPTPPLPTWMDRFMDALIGDDSRNQKYALICSQCFNHNGLVPPEAFDGLRYRCPNCGFVNAVKRNKVAGSAECAESEGNRRISEIKEEGDKNKEAAEEADKTE